MSKQVEKTLRKIHKHCDTATEALDKVVGQLEDFLELGGVSPEDRKDARLLHKQLTELFDKIERVIDQNMLSVC
jgi:hypothetical protein